MYEMVDDITAKGALARWPREALYQRQKALPALLSEVRWMSSLEFVGNGHDHDTIAAAGECYRRGSRWSYRKQPPRPVPCGMQLPGGWPEHGCHIRARELSEAYPDAGLEVYTGWVVWPEDSARMIWEHTWCVTREGLLVDPSTAICGVQEAWAYIGLPQVTFQDVGERERRFRDAVFAAMPLCGAGESKGPMDDHEPDPNW